MRRLVTSLLLAVAVVSAGPASAAEPRANFAEVEAALMCDTCNVPLNIAESTRADQQRAQIRRLIAEGRTKEEILDVFVAEYGANVLSDPAAEGGSPLVWVVPLALLVGALASLAVLLPRWRRRRRDAATAGHSPAGPALSREDDERLRRDIALYDP
jgi:cytochrome c-type biogenesis protein CcmH/NrfF